MEYKSLIPVNMQMTLRKLGAYSSAYLGNDLYYFIEALRLLIAELGEKEVRKICLDNGKDYEKISKILKKVKKLSSKAVLLYGMIQEKKFEKKTLETRPVQRMLNKFFFENVCKMDDMEQDVYDLFFLLAMKTNLPSQKIPNEAFRVLEHLNPFTNTLPRHNPRRPEDRPRESNL